MRLALFTEQEDITMVKSAQILLSVSNATQVSPALFQTGTMSTQYQNMEALEVKTPCFKKYIKEGQSLVESQLQMLLKSTWVVSLKIQLET